MFDPSEAIFGEVGADLAAVDWAKTPLGPPSGWPQSLQTVVRTMLTSRFSMWMAWGPELTFFCNHEYRRQTLASKYPWALGRPAREVWAEIWPDIGPRIDQVLTTGDATWDEGLLLFLERSGFTEESYHTFSYSPLRDDDGTIVGMLCVVVEETERVISEQRIATLGRLGAALSSASGATEVQAAAGTALEADLRCLTFAVLYVADESGELRLGTTAGVRPGSEVAPSHLAPTGEGTTPWPVPWADPHQTAGQKTEVVTVDDLAARFTDPPCGAWDRPATTALVVTLPAAAQEAPPVGLLVIGLNPYRLLDAGYRSFVSLVAGQLAAALASASAYDDEKKRAEALAELDRDKTAFFTNVSHEFRTPLTLLLGPAEDALADADDPLRGVQRTRLELVHRNAKRLMKLVDTLLQFNRLESGVADFSPQATDLSGLTRELAEAFREAVERTGLTYTVEVADLPQPVEVDRDMWAKIVLNLLSNALKFTFEGGLTVRLSHVESQALLEITDTGIGVAPDQQDRLFQRFQRVSGARSRSFEGSGIGLALVAELAAVHGGSVGVSSAPGQGSTFTVTLPAGPTAAAPAAQPETSGTATGLAEGHLLETQLWAATPASRSPDDTQPGTPADAPRPRILVADDNADMRDYISSLLSRDYDVTTVSDGLQALESARSGAPDLILTDVMMPGLDGFGLIAALQQDPATMAVPVIMLSARAGEEAVVEGLEAGADDYLSKPFTARELLARVRANLEIERIRRTRDELARSRELMDQAQRIAKVSSWEHNLVTGTVSGSEEFFRQTEITPEERAAGDLDAILTRHIHPDDVDVAQQAFERAFAGAPLEYEVRLRREDGTERIFKTLGEVVRDASGNPVAVRGSNQDITAQREAEWATARAQADEQARAREHEIAEELQRSLLPDSTAPTDALDVATFYRAGVAGTQVGGDWHDVIELGAGRTALVLGDVMGRGVRAAAVMGQLRASVRAYARLDLPPADVLEFLDGAVRDLGEDHIVTCVYAVFDPLDRSLVLANAGHLPPLLRSADGEVRPTADAGPPLGTGPMTLTETREKLGPGTSLLLYTDGLVERRDRDIDSGVAALALLFGGGEDLSPDALVARLVEGAPDDDIAVLLATVPRHGAAQPALVLPFGADRAAVADVRHEAERTLRGWAVSETVVDDVTLLVSELVTNAIVHGRPPTELRMRLTAEHVILEVRDGTTFLPRKLRPLPEDEHGRGLQLTQLLAERWGSRPEGLGKSVWCAVKL